MSDATRPPVVVSAEALRRFVADVFEAKSMSPVHAGTVSDVLVWANLRGTDSHGVSRIPRYLEMIEAGELDPAAQLQVRTESTASVLIEAQRAAGPVAMCAAMEAAADKARAAGIGLALVRATTHTAALGYYTRARRRAALRRSLPPRRSRTWHTTAHAPRACRRPRSRSRCRAIPLPSSSTWARASCR